MAALLARVVFTQKRRLSSTLANQQAAPSGNAWSQAPAWQATSFILEKELADPDRHIGQAIEASAVWCETEALLKSVPGIADITARTLLAQLPELGIIRRYQLGALVGIAPINRDSGRMQGRRSTVGGRKSVRDVLYMAPLTAVRRDSPFRAFCARLTPARST